MLALPFALISPHPTDNHDSDEQNPQQVEKLKHMKKYKFDGLVELDQPIARRVLIDLVSKTSYWADKKVFKHLRDKNKFGVWYEHVARGRPKGTVRKKTLLDDNTYANYAIKRALAGDHRMFRPRSFRVCHIYDGKTKDHRYYTCIANLVLLPSAIHSLTDHYKPVMDVLKYRAYEYYRWRPAGAAVPAKPVYYPSKKVWMSRILPMTHAVLSQLKQIRAPKKVRRFCMRR